MAAIRWSVLMSRNGNCRNPDKRYVVSGTRGAMDIVQAWRRLRSRNLHGFAFDHKVNVVSGLSSMSPPAKQRAVTC